MIQLKFKRLSILLIKNQPKLTNCNILNFSLNSKLNSDNNGNESKTKKRYNKPPPIDLKSVRTNTGDTNNDNIKQKPNVVASIVLLAVPLITFGLGVWQIRRREAKLKLIDLLEKKTKSEPIELPDDIKDFESFVKENEYRPFKLRGHFLHSKEVLLTMRHDLSGHSHLPGGHVITPFVLSKNPNMVILVNRGFVPYTHFSPTTRLKGQIDDEVEITGLIRTNEPLTTFTPVNAPPNEWHHRDVDQMAKALGTTPMFLDVIRSPSVPGSPVPGQTAIQLRNDHLTYLITWFTLSFFTSILWWKRFSRAFF